LRRQRNHILIVLLGIAALGVAAWAAIRFGAIGRLRPATNSSILAAPRSVDELWTEGLEKIKAERTDAAANPAIEIPPELRHYDDRHWFLATQIAEVRKHNLRSCQDYIDVAVMLERGELVSVPAATEDYILYGVGAKTDENAFARYRDEQTIDLYSESQLGDAYGRLDSAHTNLQSEIGRLTNQLKDVRTRDRARRADLQKQIATRQRQLKSNDDERALLNQFYGSPDTRAQLLNDYASLQSLAKNLGGRAYNLNDASDRKALKVNLLRSIRPEALKVIEEVAADYRRQFNRPLPVSSLVRPEAYQHVLRRFNRNAVLIDTPPHSTGLAFDIDYRYMSNAEQNFLMAKLARLKDAGRIEVIRERNANYHVFVFIDGVRPDDELIKTCLEAAGESAEELDDTKDKPAEAKAKPRETKKSSVKPKAKRRR
jgi:uncharacterized protein DUF5715